MSMNPWTARIPFDQTGVAITGGSITGVSGAPYLIAQSAVPVNGTNTANEEAYATVAIPILGANDRLIVTMAWTMTSSANSKTARIRWSTISGTAFMVMNAAINISTLQSQTALANRNATNSQQVTSVSFMSTSAVHSPLVTTGAIDTSAATSLVLTGQKTTGTETLTLESYSVWLVKS
jgi:hypothetical protein